MYDVLVTLAAIDTFESIRHAAGQNTRSSLADRPDPFPLPVAFCPFSRRARTKSGCPSPALSSFLLAHGATRRELRPATVNYDPVREISSRDRALVKHRPLNCACARIRVTCTTTTTTDARRRLCNASRRATSRVPSHADDSADCRTSMSPVPPMFCICHGRVCRAFPRTA